MNVDSDKAVKPFKLCFNNEIHRISKLPTDYQALVQNVATAFKSSLPMNWALQYEDADGDRVMLTSDDDYKAMLECELESNSKSIKIFLLPLEENVSSEGSAYKHGLKEIPLAESVDYSRILLAPQQESKPAEQYKYEEGLPKELEEQLQILEPEKKEEKLHQDEIQREEVLKEESLNEEAQVQDKLHVEDPKEIVYKKVEEGVPDIQVCLMQPSNESYCYVEGIANNEGNLIQTEAKACEQKDQEAVYEEKFHEVQRHPGCKWGGMKHRKEKMRELITDLMVENIPAIAELVRDYLKDASSFNAEEAKKKLRPQEEAKSEASIPYVHTKVCCDGCGTNPIVGIRYKCAICQDFDYCEKCESSIEHPHPFLKIKDPKHHPKAMITVLHEEYSDIPNMHQNHSNLIEKIANLIPKVKTEIVQKISSEVPPKVEVIEQIEEKKIEEPMKEEKAEESCKPAALVKEIESENKKVEKEQAPLFDVAFAKEMSTIPSKVTVNDKVIYKTISLQNTGKNEWPRNSIVKNVGGVSGQDSRVPQLAPGKAFSCILILENPAKAGEYTSSWKLAYVGDKGDLQYIGEQFTVGFAVVEPELSESHVIKVKAEEEKPKVPEKEEEKIQKVENPKVPEKEEEKPKKVEKPKKEYPKKVVELARHLKELFSDAAIEDLLEIVSHSPNQSIEQLVDSYLSSISQ